MSYMNYPFGIKENELLYFRANRFYPDDKYFKYNKHLKGKKEIVSYDCGIFDLDGIIKLDFNSIRKDTQIIAIIINPKLESTHKIDSSFEFCGYDLCEEGSAVIAITNCGCEYDKAIDYLSLNKYGLIDNYEVAVDFQRKLIQLYPYESHATCQVIKIYRYVIEK